ncbi:MAG: hypothetical protein GC156_07835 [Actinomycetales bacterium]|nr:hypothetical protein [Actinomycetales bacterium]
MTPSRSRRMLQLALTPRWLLLLLVLVAFVIATVLLGRWQWERTQSILDAERAAASQPIPILDAFPDRQPGQVPDDMPSESIGRPVIVTGQYDPGMQAIITSRSLDGEAGVWVVTGVPQPDGTVAAVLRGWLPDAGDAGSAVPSGAVEVQGVLQPDEPFYVDAPIDGDQTVVISSGRLARMWGAPVLPGFVVLQQERPPVDPAPIPVPQTVQTADVPFPLQNFFYAFQWWIFAGFGVVVYVRWLWIEAGREEEPALAVD